LDEKEVISRFLARDFPERFTRTYKNLVRIADIFIQQYWKLLIVDKIDWEKINEFYSAFDSSSQLKILNFLTFVYIKCEDELIFKATHQKAKNFYNTKFIYALFLKYLSAVLDYVLGNLDTLQEPGVIQEELKLIYVYLFLRRLADNDSILQLFMDRKGVAELLCRVASLRHVSLCCNFLFNSLSPAKRGSMPVITSKGNQRNQKAFCRFEESAKFFESKEDEDQVEKEGFYEKLSLIEDFNGSGLSKTTPTEIHKGNQIYEAASIANKPFGQMLIDTYEKQQVGYDKFSETLVDIEEDVVLEEECFPTVGGEKVYQDVLTDCFREVIDLTLD